MRTKEINLTLDTSSYFWCGVVDGCAVSFCHSTMSSFLPEGVSRRWGGNIVLTLYSAPPQGDSVFGTLCYIHGWQWRIAIDKQEYSLMNTRHMHTFLCDWVSHGSDNVWFTVKIV